MQTGGVGTPFDLVYVCDAWPAIGMGHLARALDVLAEARRRAPDARLGLAGRFAPSAERFLEGRVPAGVAVLDEASPWSAEALALDTMAVPGDPAAIDAARAEALRRRCGTFVLVSSSLEVRTVAGIDVVIDHMPGARIEGPRPGRCCFGLEYAPVSREFFEVEPVPPDEADALVAVLGGSDRQTGPEVTATLLGERVLDAFRSAVMVVSPHFPAGELDSLRRRHPRWVFRRNVPSLAPLLAGARAVLCTYGNITYESLALGRPTFVLGYREFQRRYAEVLEERGLVACCGLFDDPDRGKLAGIGSPAVLAGLARAAASAGVGCGPAAIARVLLEEGTRVQNA